MASFLSSDIRRGVIAVALLAGFIALFAFAPPDDPTKVASGIPCSVLTENQVSAVIGTQMRLMPTSGAICHYVATESGDMGVFIVAHHDTSLSGRLPSGAVAVRAGSHVYTVAVVSHDALRAAPPAAAFRLAKLVQRPMIAANR